MTNSDELKILYEYIDAVGEKIDTITTKVVDRFISTFVDDELLGSQQDPHFYTQTVMREFMSDDGREDIANTVEGLFATFISNTVTRSSEQQESIVSPRVNTGLSTHCIIQCHKRKTILERERENHILFLF